MQGAETFVTGATWKVVRIANIFATPQVGDFAFKHLRGPSVFANELNKTATAQIDGSNAGAGFFDA